MSYDVLVIGGGPAGLSAAVNVRARGGSVLVVSNPPEESPLWRAERVDNHLGMPAMTGGELLAQDVVPGHISSCLSLLEGAGCRVETGPDWVRLTAPERLEAFGTVKTMPYPGFPTDMQSVMMAAATVARGTTLFVENMFESRYRHVPELRKLGASIVTEGRAAVVTGVERLTGASLVSTDLRGGAAVVLGALAAEGESVVAGLDHIDRGYDDLEGNLRRLGADIKRDG